MSAIRTPTPIAPDALGVSYGSTLQGHGPPGGADDEWRWADVSGQQRLVTCDELRAALASGVIAPNTPVWRRGWRDWRPAYDVPELTTSALAAANGILPNIPPPPLAMVAVQREFEADAAQTPRPTKTEAPPPPAYAPAPSWQGQSVSHAPPQRASKRSPSVQPPPMEASAPGAGEGQFQPLPRTTAPFPDPRPVAAPVEATTIVNVRALTDRDLERIAGKTQSPGHSLSASPSPVVIPAISLAPRTEGPPRAKSVSPAPPVVSAEPRVPSRKPPPPQSMAPQAASGASRSKAPPPPPAARVLLTQDLEEVDVDEPVEEELSGSLLLPDLLVAPPPPSRVAPRAQESVEELSASVLVADPSILLGGMNPMDDLGAGFLLRAEASHSPAPYSPSPPSPARSEAPAEAATLVRAPAVDAPTLVRAPALAAPAPIAAPAPLFLGGGTQGGFPEGRGVDATFLPRRNPGEAQSISAFAAPAGSAPPPPFAPPPAASPPADPLTTQHAYLGPSYPAQATEIAAEPLVYGSTFDASFRNDDVRVAPPGVFSAPPVEAFVPPATVRRRSPGALPPPEGLGFLPFHVPAVAPLALVGALAVIGLVGALFTPTPAAVVSHDPSAAAPPVAAVAAAPAAPNDAPVPAPGSAGGSVATATAALEPAPADAPSSPIVATPSTAACVLTGNAHVLSPKALVASGVEVQVVGKRVGVGFATTPREGFAFAVDPSSLAVTQKVHARTLVPIRRLTPVGGLKGFDAAASIDAAAALSGRRTVTADPPLDLGVVNHALAWSPSRTDEANTLWSLEGDGAVDAFRAAPLGTLAGDGWAIAFRQGATLYAGVITGGAHPAPRGPLVRVAGLGAQVGSPAIASADGVVFVAWADRAGASDPWGIRWVHFNVGSSSAEAHSFTVPEGGLGGQAMSPGVAAVGAGRFLLLWTEGPVANHQVRGQTLDAQGAPLGAAMTLSAAGLNAGQGQAGFLPDGRGLVAYLAARDSGASSFEVLASPIACKP